MLLFSLIFLLVSPLVIESYDIKATGGGVVKLGSDLELSLEVGKVWDRCRWFVYEHKLDYEYCSFDLNTEFGNATLHKCSNATFNSVMDYTGTDTKTCTITIHNVSEEYNCTWAARLDEDLTNSNISVTIAAAVEEVIIEAPEELVAGMDGNIICTVKGGRPAPILNFDFGESSPEMVNDTITQTPDDDGIFTSVQEVFIKPKIEDHGKQVKCEASIKDNENVTLYNAVAASEAFELDIKFPPQPSANQSLNANKGDNLTITFTFKANPLPQDIKWVVTIPEIVNSENGTNDGTNETVVEMTPGHEDDKYMISNLTSDVDLQYKATMTIFDLEDQDVNDTYFLSIGNDFGTQMYYFEISFEATTTTAATTTAGTTITTTTATNNGTNGNGGNGGTDDTETSNVSVLIVVVALITITMLLSAFLIVYKRNKVHNETTPLSTLETRRN